MRNSKKQTQKPFVRHRLTKAAKKSITIKAINTKPGDWVNRQTVMQAFGFSLRTMQYYHDRGIFPFSMLDKRIFYYLPGILQILEQTLHY